jgi:hypothetical protein
MIPGIYWLKLDGNAHAVRSRAQVGDSDTVVTALVTADLSKQT